MNGVLAIVLGKSNKKVLLVKRRDVPIWVVPGGGIESNETPEQAIVREVKEESGYKVNSTKIIAEYINDAGNRKNYLILCKLVGGKAEINSEAKGISFFDLNNLPETSHPHLSIWLKDYKKNSKSVLKKKMPVIKLFSVLAQITKHPVLVVRYLLLKVGLRINT